MASKKTDQIIEPIPASFDALAKAVLVTPSKSKPVKKSAAPVDAPPKAMYWGKLPIGDIELDCVVLNNGERILTATSIFQAFGRARKGMNTRLEIDGTKLPPFVAAKNLEPYVNQSLINRTKLVSYLDGGRVKTGYVAALLPTMCSLYLTARRHEALLASQEKLAIQAEIISSALALVGIDALVDEATGYQMRWSMSDGPFNRPS